RTADLLERLPRGGTGAPVSHAGMPPLSDPGGRPVAGARGAGGGGGGGAGRVARAGAAGFEVGVVPGPSAPASALAVSGLPAVPHTFLGFLPAREGERRRSLETLRAPTEPRGALAAPHR